MSQTFQFSAIGSSVLSCDFFPPIELDRNKKYGLGLIGFYGVHSLKNINNKNNLITFLIGDNQVRAIIPPGAYEIEEINVKIQKELQTYYSIFPNASEIDMNSLFLLKPNNNTLKCELYSTNWIDFEPLNSIAKTLGFTNTKLKPGVWHQSTYSPQIVPTNIVRIETNITAGSYINGESAHTLYAFDIDVEPGYRIIKEPQNILYMPIFPENRQYIDNLLLRIVGDDDKLLDFGDEYITVILELKEFM